MNTDNIKREIVFRYDQNKAGFYEQKVDIVTKCLITNAEKTETFVEPTRKQLTLDETFQDIMMELNMGHSEDHIRGMWEKVE